MRTLANRRKAIAGETLTRWVKLPGFGKSKRKTAPMPVDAVGTRFPKQVVRPSEIRSLLVSGHSNIKIGRDVRKGHFRGYRIYTLSLEERATCPRSCQHWRTCYGNAEPFAKRIDHTDPHFLAILEREIDRLVTGTYHPLSKASGILIRLHALGDFYSVEYVDFWRRMLDRHERLAIYGYTAHKMTWRDKNSIGGRVARVTDEFGERFAIRWSNGTLYRRSTVSIGSSESCPPNAFVCPEQTGKTKCCATCGACWSTTKNVAFLEH